MSLADRQKWNARYAERQRVPQAPSLLLTSLAELLPAGGRALDVAGGAGRHALWLAQRGLDVTIVDIAAEGLAICRRQAAEEGLQLNAICRDLESEPLPSGPWELIVSFFYLQRPLFPQMAAELASGGMLVFCQPTRRNLQRHTRPPAEFLIDEGELPQLAAGLEVVQYREGWLEEGRHDALLVARKP